MGSVGIAFVGGPSAPEMVRLSRLAESRGFDSVWVSETRITRDGFVPAAAIAQATERIKVGTAIVNVFTRGPVLTAISFATLDELSGGRALAGIGPGSPTVLAAQGEDFAKPLTRLREYVEVSRRLWAGQEVNFAGEIVRLSGARLEFKPPRSRIPVYMGVSGPKALRLAGQAAEGVLLDAFTHVDYMERALGRIGAAAREAGRDPLDVDVAALVFTAMDRDSTAAKNRMRPHLAMYLSRFPSIAVETGFDEGLIDRICRVMEEEGPGAAAPLVTDDMVDRLAAAGTPGECREWFHSLRDIGVGTVLVCPLGSNIEEMIHEFSPSEW